MSSTIPAVTGRLMVLDTPSLYFRAFYGVPESVTAPDGTPVNAVRGLLDFLARLVTDRRPTHLVATFDADWRPAFRVAALPSYKAHRLGPDGKAEIVPAGLVPQVPVIEALLDAFGSSSIHGASITTCRMMAQPVFGGAKARASRSQSALA